MLRYLKRIARYVVFGKPRRKPTPYAIAKREKTAQLRRELQSAKALDVVCLAAVERGLSE